MKKFLSIILSILIIIPSSVALAADGYEPNPIDEITQAEALEFADELRELDGEVSQRLIVGADKDIDIMGAVDVADGIEGLYVLQYDSKSAAKKAFDYYNSLSYVRYVEYDFEQTNIINSTDDEFDFVCKCYSTAYCNIDDSIKLLHKEYGNLPEIKVAVCDSGIANTSVTESRLDYGYSFLADDGYSEDGTDDKLGHGSLVAGAVILNTLDNVRLHSYQIIEEDDSATISDALSAIYLAAANGCNVINCSFGFSIKSSSTMDSFNEAVNYASEKGAIVVAAAGNESSDLATSNKYPALCDNSIAVGATTMDNYIFTSSNFGPAIDIFAPGRWLKTYDKKGNETHFSGTSAAAPVISSIVTMLFCAAPDLTVDETKQLLLETGYATYENGVTTATRIIADSYSALKQLTGKELPQVSLDYTVSKNDDTGYSDLTFTCDDDAIVYYHPGLGNIQKPYKITSDPVYSSDNGTTIILQEYCTVVACAYAPGKAKSITQIFITPEYSDESGYLLTKKSTTQQYNMIRRCQFIDDKIIEVPQYIGDTEIQEIGKCCFTGLKNVETIILPSSVKKIDEYAFANSPNLKTVIAPGVTRCARYAFYNCTNLEEINIPNLTTADTALCMNCPSLKYFKSGILKQICNHAFYGCENLKLVKTTDDDISFSLNTFRNCDDLTVYTPEGSAMETYAIENNIPLLGSVQANGGSIRVTDAGLRFGYQYNGEENKNIEEYGFVYNSGVTNDLTVDNSLKLIANNRINHGDYTTYNLVFTSVPYTDKAFNQMISAKAYIKIGGEYFYSDVVQHSYNTVANAVLNDDTVDSTTKDAVQNILKKVV